LKKNYDYLKNSNNKKYFLIFVDLHFILYREEDDDNNGAVEGPIPLEPDEKLYGYKRDESKIRQL